MKEILQVRAMLESRDARALNGGTVHAGIRIGKAQLNGVDASVREDLASTN